MKVGLSQVLVLVYFAFCPMPTLAGQSSQDNLQVFVGEITDSFCAKDGSRPENVDQVKSTAHEKKACTKRCIEGGGKIVLYDTSRRTVYRLDNTERVLPFAGQKVRITGTLRRNKITVATIENVL